MDLMMTKGFRIIATDASIQQNSSGVACVSVSGGDRIDWRIERRTPLSSQSFYEFDKWSP